MSAKTKKLLSQLHSLLGVPDGRELEIDVAAAEMTASAATALACGHDVDGSAAACVQRVEALGQPEREMAFERAREMAARTANDRRRQQALAVLEQLIEGVRAGIRGERPAPSSSAPTMPVSGRNQTPRQRQLRAPGVSEDEQRLQPWLPSAE